jgi:lipopolysaccharide exporter
LNTKTYWFRSGVITILDRFSILLFGFGGFYFLVRSVSKEDFGIWALFLAITTLVEIARSGLIQNAVVKFLASSPNEEHPKIISASLALNVILTTISGLILFSISGLLSDLWHAPNLESMFKYYVFTTVALIPFSQFNFIQQANFDFKGIFASNLVRQGILFGYILTNFILDRPIELLDLVNVQTIAALAGSLTSYIFCLKYLSLSKQIEWKWVFKLFHYGKFVFGTNISSVLFKSGDQMLLGYLVAPTAVALFNITTRVINLFEVPISSVASIVFPQSSKRINEEGISVAKELYEKSVGVMLLMVIPGILLLLIFTEFFVILIAGYNYLDVVPILRLTLVQIIFIPFGRQFGTILDSIGRPHINFYFIVVSAIFNFIINYFLISYYGIMGAVYGTLIMYLISFIFTQWYLRKFLDIDFRNTIKYALSYFNSVIKRLSDVIRRTKVKE